MFNIEDREHASFIYVASFAFPLVGNSARRIEQHKKPCHKWAAGNCTWGERCHFAHGELGVARSEGQKQSFTPGTCFMLQKAGVCQYGDSCKWSHDLGPRAHGRGSVGKARPSGPGIPWNTYAPPPPTSFSPAVPPGRNSQDHVISRPPALAGGGTIMSGPKKSRWGPTSGI